VSLRRQRMFSQPPASTVRTNNEEFRRRRHPTPFVSKRAMYGVVSTPAEKPPASIIPLLSRAILDPPRKPT
jgi:hypothetical protein